MLNYKVYIHTNKINNKKYIGITCQKPIQRWKNGNGYKECPKFWNAIKKYGWDNFEHEVVLCNLTKEQAEMFEIEMIKYYQSNNSNFGYNISNGGNTIGTHSEETKNKISIANKGKKATEYTKEKLRKNHANFKGKNHPQYGSGKKVICLETKDIFLSCKEASKKFNIDKTSIYKTCAGKQITSNGLHFCYLDDYKNNNVKIKNNNKKRKVICIETKEIFESVSDCEHKTNLHNISKVCKGKAHSSGGYHFCYLEDYNKDKEYDLRVGYSFNKIPVICVETNEIFDSAKQASIDMNLDSSAITSICKGINKTTKGYSFKYYTEDL